MYFAVFFLQVSISNKEVFGDTTWPNLSFSACFYINFICQIGNRTKKKKKRET